MVYYDFHELYNIDSTIKTMDQAFTHFNSGKYKQSFNQLNSSPLNVESYQPNLIISEYSANRSIQSSQQCLRKLTQLLGKKNKKDNEHHERLTEQLIKYNVGVLMHINAKKQNAFFIIDEVFQHEKCFIDYLKYRMLLLLMELSICLKSSVRTLLLGSKYIDNKPEQKAPPQWISLVFHEHSKNVHTLREEFSFLLGIFISQALMQLGAAEVSNPFDWEWESLKDFLIDKAKKRKSVINKYYEINLLMIDRFYQSQKEFHHNNCDRSIQLLHFANIQNQYEQMPQTKIITNIYSSLSNNNIGIINFSRSKKAVALYFFNKAQSLLQKACTGVQDKDLQLFSSNYANHHSRISYNLGLLALSMKSSHSFSIFENIKKGNHQKMDFKYWYRVGQAQLSYYHQNYSRMNCDQRQKILDLSLKSFSTSLICLNKRQIPDLKICQSVRFLKEDEIETITIRFNGQTENFKQNITLLICYISLCLQRYYRVITHSKELLKCEKTTDHTKIHALYYLVEAYTKSNRLREANKYQRQAQKLSKGMKKEKFSVYYESGSVLIHQKTESQALLAHTTALLRTQQGYVGDGISVLQKEKNRDKASLHESTDIYLEYLKEKQKFSDKKYS